MLLTWSIIGLVVAVILFLIVRKMRESDHLEEIVKKRQPGAKVVSRGEYVEGMEKIPVVMSLTGDTFYYENADLEASFDVARIDEVEYDDELATGKSVEEDAHVLRLRSHGAAFEFLLSKSESAKWTAALPPKKMGEQNAAAAV